MLHGFRQDLDIFKIPEFSVPIEPVTGPCGVDDFDGFVKTSSTFFDGHSKYLELDRIEAPACAPVHAATRENIEEGYLFCEPQRMIEGSQRYRHTNTDVPGLIGDVHAHHVDGGADAVSAEVMLGKPDSIVSRVIHDMNSLHGALVDGGQRHSPFRPTEELEDSELHFLSVQDVL